MDHGSRPAEAPTVAPAPKTHLEPGEVVVIAVLAVSAFIVIFNEMVMGVALPQVMAELGITAATGQWLTTAYALTMAVIIPATGFLMQRFNMRPLFVATMALFTVGTAIAAVAPTFEVLLTGRIVQAAGTATLAPLMMATTFRLAPEGRRGSLMALTTAVGAVAPAIGPAISGLIVANLSWRWIFILVLPLALIALVVGGILMRNLTTPVPSSIDATSLILAAIGFGALVFGLASAHDTSGGHLPTSSLLAVVLGLAGIAAFVLRQRRLQRRDAALLDMRIFTHRGFTLASIVVLFLVSTAFGVGVLLPLVLQDVLGLGVLETGLLLVPGGAAIAIVSAIVGRLYEKTGPRTLVIIGALIDVAALWFMSTATPERPVAVILLTHLAICTGQAFMWTALFTLALASLPENLYGHGSAALNTLQQLGGAIGVAVLITVLTITSDAGDPAANAGGGSLAGVQGAFTAAAVIAAAAVIGALFLPGRAKTTGTGTVPVSTGH
ncbi:DHA2 family efflux MFS transporter permease subunit [Paenibacillus sp. TRM 82003]|uniref:DHA2 family efflux MFS transporter permease subunit n=1 Tax=Kineococcus sp. TRM81007 TaxID=2925831 RepID=UPI001F576A95|nr:DHA2 family efflux MFS transporter permease subunit [Kineococcus sp. TRM81007]MCI2238574.1 DHA2 family efflux MFS transporter permease subunit [Kineococcus sp. TRM81007]MCI3924567.1 DHA2 family efflux MFS transporter permease subunit [Paenibacillus sp. TRM 82003]